ncbi:MAG: ribosome biogenesis GTP-binding protein YihA/YsxC [Nitrospinota bacterium]
MKIPAAEFEKSALHPRDCPKQKLPEVAFAGRSNVGKSSVMNTLLGRRGLVKTSSTPGKTQTLNFFRVRSGKAEFRFVDLPGYGFAKVPERMRKSWAKIIETYLEGREQLRGVVVILDIRRGVTEMDRELLDWLAAAGIEALIVLTKADKVSGSKRAAAAATVQRELRRELRIEPPLGPEDPVVFSSANGLGKDALWRRLNGWLRTPAGVSRK